MSPHYLTHPKKPRFRTRTTRGHTVAVATFRGVTFRIEALLIKRTPCSAIAAQRATSGAVSRVASGGGRTLRVQVKIHTGSRTARRKSSRVAARYEPDLSLEQHTAVERMFSINIPPSSLPPPMK
ncbi:hypothetical protein MRX96_009748 [Rhipicephalus microplus]